MIASHSARSQIVVNVVRYTRVGGSLVSGSSVAQQLPMVVVRELAIIIEHAEFFATVLFERHRPRTL